MAWCKSCGAQIVWIKSINGKSIPCNMAPVRFTYELTGPDKVVSMNGEVLRGVISSDGDEVGYISHFATCPNADAHRRKK